MKLIQQSSRYVNPVVTAFASLVLAILVVVMIYQIGSRYLLGSTPSWTSEIAILMMGWLSFLGIVIGLRDRTHIAITLVAKRFPRAIQTLFDYIALLGMLGFGTLMITYGTEFTLQATGSTLSSTGLPRSLVYGIMPVSGVLIVFYCVEQIVQLATRKEIVDDR